MMLIAAGSILRIASYFLSNNAGGDAAERVALTAHWLQLPTPQLIFLGYPPGHFWLMAAVGSMISNVLVAGRLLSLFCGIATLFVVWNLANILYGTTAALFSVGVCAFYSLHIGYSATSSSEATFLFFLSLGLMFFFSYFARERKNLAWLAAAGITFSIAESIRFEAWTLFAGLVVIFPFLWLWGSGHERVPLMSSVGPLLIFSFTGGIWPVVLMSYCWRVFGDPMYLMTKTHTYMAKVLETSANSRGYELALIPTVLLITLSPVALAAAFYGVMESRRRPLAIAFAGLTIFLIAIQNYEILHNGFLAVARYSLTPGVMLCVISGFGFERICTKLLPGKMILAQCAVIALLILNVFAILAMSDIPNRYADKFAAISPRLRYQSRIAGVGRYLRKHMNPQDVVVIDDYNVESNIIADAAGLPILAGKRAYLQSSKNEMDARKFILTEHPRFLVYSDAGTLNHELSLPPDCKQEVKIDGIEFHCKFANQIYRVYELSYQ
jgi:4-amino-4-deoxy-L-arabinose transferase-like glycosyltransferase